MSCTASLAPDICPTADELVVQYRMLIPRGRAWGEGGPGREPGGIIYGFLYFCAIVMAAYHAAICKLRLEFFCQTAVDTVDWWAEEYGFPDDCNPYPDVCAKVRAVGGATPAALEARAAALGWAVFVGSPAAGVLMITVSLADSPAYAGGTPTYGRAAGCYQAGQRVSCGPDLTPLDCALQRVAHAHLTLEYQFT